MEPIITRGTVVGIELDYQKKERVSIRFEGEQIRERFNSSGSFHLNCPNYGWKLGDELEMEIRPVLVAQAATAA